MDTLQNSTEALQSPSILGLARSRKVQNSSLVAFPVHATSVAFVFVCKTRLKSHVPATGLTSGPSRNSLFTEYPYEDFFYGDFGSGSGRDGFRSGDSPVDEGAHRSNAAHGERQAGLQRCLAKPADGRCNRRYWLLQRGQRASLHGLGQGALAQL